MRIRELLAIQEGNIGPNALRAVASIPSPATAKRVKYNGLRRSYGRPEAALKEMMPVDPTTDQMHPPPDPQQMQMAPAVKADGEIEDAAAAVPPKAVMELFDVQAPVQQVSPSQYGFTVDGKEFTMSFVPTDTGAVEVVLSRKNPGDYKSPYDTLNDFGKNPIVVYSTSLKVIEQYLQTHQPDVLFFYGFVPDQQRVYSKVAQHAIGRFPDYEVQEKAGTIALVRRLREDLRSMVTRLEHDKMARAEHSKLKGKKPVATGGISHPALAK